MQKQLPSGLTHVKFTGLKLNTMTKIKDQLKTHNIRHAKEYYICFTVGDLQIKTNSFKMVSTCRQIPQELRALVRPKIL